MLIRRLVVALVRANQPDLEIRSVEVRSLTRTRQPKFEVTQLPLRPFDGLIDLICRYKRAVEELDVYPRPNVFCSDTCAAIAACRTYHGMEVAG